MQLSRGAVLAIGLLIAAPAPALSQTTPPQTTPSSTSTATSGAGTQDLTVKDWLQRPGLFGDWGGTKQRMADRGTTIDAYWTQFFAHAPGRPPFGDEYGWDYGGKLDAKIQHDFSKQGWDGVSLTSHIEFRYGDTTLFAGGTLMPTNAAMLLPENEGNAINFTSLYLTKMFGPSTVLQAGRFSAVDLYAKPFTGGEGVDKFMNVAFVAPPLMARTMPFVFEGVLMTSLKGSEPFITAGLFESTQDGFFANGATVFGSVALPLNKFITPGHYVVSGTYSSVEATSLDQTPYALIPAFDVPLETEKHAWTFDLTMDQYIWWDEDKKEGWGVFGSIGWTDSNPSPIDLFVHIGLGGTGMIPKRPRDTWGAGYYVAGVSNTMRESLDPFVRLRNESGGEFYYNVAIAGWSRVTADFQFIDPFGVGAKTRVPFAIRWKVIF